MSIEKPTSEKSFFKYAVVCRVADAVATTSSPLSPETTCVDFFEFFRPNFFLRDGFDECWNDFFMRVLPSSDRHIWRRGQFQDLPSLEVGGHLESFEQECAG